MNDEGEFTYERLYINPNRHDSALIDVSEIQAGEVERLSALLTALENQLSQNLCA